jgi:DNA-binding NtrC family response regulator
LLIVDGVRVLVMFISKPVYTILRSVKLSVADNGSSGIKPPARILIIDDEGDITEVIMAGLKRNGLLAEAFTDPAKALEHFREHSHDYCLAVIDIRMPNISGYELARKFEKINPNVKKVLMSAYEIHEREFARLMPSTKIDDFARKPFTIPELKAIILKHIAGIKTLSES